MRMVRNIALIKNSMASPANRGEKPWIFEGGEDELERVNEGMSVTDSVNGKSQV